MMILFEGPDKSGKTTLLRNIAEVRPNSGIWKNTIFKPNSSVYSQGKIAGLYLGFYEAMKIGGDGRYPLFVDRSHITELVYAPIKRNYEPDIVFWREYEPTMDAVVVYVDTPADIMLKRLMAEGDDYVNPDELVRIKFAYDDYFRRFCRLTVIRIDGSKTETEMVIELNHKLNEYLRKENKGR